MIILNLTQHEPTPEQVSAGVVDLECESRDFLIENLTFREMPTRDEIEKSASSIATLARAIMLKIEDRKDAVISGKNAVLVGGAPWFMSALENALKERGIKVLYAFSKRESVEEMQVDGSVKKSMIFKHLGFLEA